MLQETLVVPTEQKDLFDRTLVRINVTAGRHFHFYKQPHAYLILRFIYVIQRFTYDG